MDQKLVTRYIFLDALRLSLMGAALFLSSGQVDWWPAWGALAVMAGWMIATAIYIFRYSPDLLAERLGTQPGSQQWDAYIMIAFYLLSLLRYIIAGLDHRYSWSGVFPPGVQFAGLIICALGYTLFTWATISNPFFSRIVRIQVERGHSVVAGGPYHWLRHPGYLGAITYELAVAFLLGSWLALLVGAIIVGLFILRTALEDRTLMVGLNGYAAYARQVRWRLLPGIW